MWSGEHPGLNNGIDLVPKCGWVNPEAYWEPLRPGALWFVTFEGVESRHAGKPWAPAVMVATGSGSNAHFIFKDFWGLTALKEWGETVILIVTDQGLMSQVLSAFCQMHSRAVFYVWTLELSEKLQVISSLSVTRQGEGQGTPMESYTCGEPVQLVCRHLSSEPKTWVPFSSILNLSLLSRQFRNDPGSSGDPCFPLRLLSSCKWTMILSQRDTRDVSLWEGGHLTGVFGLALDNFMGIISFR